MDREQIEREVRRLSPWYYRFDLQGVSTDITPPCDHHGHRDVAFPDEASRFLAKKTVLDAACNEGGYSFAALGRGAKSVVAFDVRSVNVEKARFVAGVQGWSEVEFHVSSVDSWLERSRDTHDFVFLCGLLYHLTEPWRTIEQYAALAREGMFLTCVLTGGVDGYTPFPEQENIAASENPDELSMMPNTTRTLVRELAKQGFVPRYMNEERTGRYWGGCALLVTRMPAGVTVEDADDPDTGVELYLVPLAGLAPGGRGRLQIVLYNGTEAAVRAVGELEVHSSNGKLLSLPPQEVSLVPQASAAGGSASQSVEVELDLSDQGPGVTIAARLRSPEKSRLLASKSLAFHEA